MEMRAVAEKPIMIPTDLTVKKHRKDVKAGKEPVYKIELETPEKHDPVMKLTITSNNDIRQDFPLNQIFTFSFSKPQKTLDQE